MFRIQTRTYNECNGCTFSTPNMTNLNAPSYFLEFGGLDTPFFANNCDFTGVRTPILCNSDGTGDSSRFVNCQYWSGATTLFQATNPTGRHEFLGVTNGADEFQTYIRDAYAELTADSSVTLGYDFSYLIDTTATLSSKVGGVKFDIWSGRLDMSTAKTFSVEIAQDGVSTTLDNAQIWLVVAYRDASNNLVRESARPATLASVATHATSTASWTGLGGTNSRQTLSITSTAGGHTDTAVTVGVIVAEPNILVNIDPAITVT